MDNTNNDELNGNKSKGEKHKLKFKTSFDSDKRVLKKDDNNECNRKQFYDRDNNDKENKDIIGEDLNASQMKKSLETNSSQFHARFAASDDDLDNQDVIEKEIVRKTSSTDSRTRILGPVVSPKRPNLNNQKSNNTIPSSVEYKASTIRQHYYPEGSWGWVVVICAMYYHIITFGIQLCYGIFLMHLIKQPFGHDMYMPAIWLGSLSLSVSYFITPVLVSWCRRKSARLTAIAGGLVSSLGCLFASFATQYHQVVLSYGIFLSIGIGIARESSNLMVGQYFKRRRSYVEIFVQSSIGIGVAVMAPFLDWSIGSFKHWRAGLQLITCSLFTTFIVGILFRPASLYHPQRRAILHLKTQRRKIREKNPQTNKPPFFDLIPLKERSLQIIIISTVIFSLGYLSPIFYLTTLVPHQNLTNEEPILLSPKVIPTSTIVLYIYFGISFTIGVILFGCLTAKRSFEPFINRQYLCQFSMFSISTLLMILIFITEYNSHIIFMVFYGIAVGSFHYNIKMFLFSQVRAKTFGKSWSYMLCGNSFAILFGIPLTGYINIWFESETYNYGFLLSTISCFIGFLLLFCLNIYSKRTLLSVGNKLAYHQHSCNTEEINNLNGVTAHHTAVNYSRSSDSGITSIDYNQCCGCGQKLLSSEENSGFKDYQSVKTDDLKESSIKISRAEDEDDDEDFLYSKFNAQDLGTFLSDELCNYYLENECEEEMALFDESNESVRDRIINDCQFDDHISTIDFTQQKNKFICDTNDVKHSKASKRTIETVTEETSSIT